MADSNTTNYNLVKPELDGSDDTWGEKLNDDLDTIDSTIKGVSNVANAALPKAGGTLTGNLSLGDNVKAQFGASNDLQIYHDGGFSSYIDSGSKDLYIRGDRDLYIQAKSGEASISAFKDGSVKLYNDNSEKLATTNSGINVSGTVAATSFTGDGSALTGIDALPTQTGHTGKYLGTDGSTATWNTLDTDANSTTKGLYEHANTISANYSISSGSNALTAGPITINTGVSVTIPTGSTWVIA